MNETLALTREGPIALLTLNRPEASNAMTGPLRAALAAALRAVAGDDTVRVVILGGAGRAFCAGADLREAAPADSEQQLRDEYRPIFEAIAGMPQLVLAVVNGPAAGIGMSLALACDLVVMADDAWLVAPFCQIGLTTDGGASWLLARALGPHRALQLVIEAERISATRALECGLINRIEPRDALPGRAIEWAHSLAARAPGAIAATKRAVRHAMEHAYFETFDFEAHQQAACAASPEFEEGVRAFLEKRSPRFGGRGAREP